MGGPPNEKTDLSRQCTPTELMSKDSYMEDVEPRKLHLTPVASSPNPTLAPASDHPPSPAESQTTIPAPPSQLPEGAITLPPVGEVPPEKKDPSGKHQDPNQVPSQLPEQPRQAEVKPPGPQKTPEVEGTMYTDGTYWRSVL